MELELNNLLDIAGSWRVVFWMYVAFLSRTHGLRRQGIAVNE